jgi:hypothetical protein
MANHFSRGRPVTAVERGLPAAGLVLREIDLTAEIFEHLDRGAGDVAIKRITDARGHQLHASIRGGLAT